MTRRCGCYRRCARDRHATFQPAGKPGTITDTVGGRGRVVWCFRRSTTLLTKKRHNGVRLGRDPFGWAGMNRKRKLDASRRRGGGGEALATLASTRPRSGLSQSPRPGGPRCSPGPDSVPLAGLAPPGAGAAGAALRSGGLLRALFKLRRCLPKAGQRAGRLQPPFVKFDSTCRASRGRGRVVWCFRRSTACSRRIPKSSLAGLGH